MSWWNSRHNPAWELNRRKHKVKEAAKKCSKCRQQHRHHKMCSKHTAMMREIETEKEKAAKRAFEKGKKRASERKRRKSRRLEGVGTHQFASDIQIIGNITKRKKLPSHARGMYDDLAELMSGENQEMEWVWGRRRKYVFSDRWLYRINPSKITNPRLNWHGTNVSNVYAITEAGRLKVERSRGGMLGRGIYTTPSAKKAKTYTVGSNYMVFLLVEQNLDKHVEIPGELFGNGPKVERFVRQHRGNTAYVKAGEYDGAWGGVIRNDEYCAYKEGLVNILYAVIIKRTWTYID